MSIKPLFGPTQTGLEFPVLENIHRAVPIEVRVPETATFHVGNGASAAPAVKTGDKVKTGGLVRSAVSTVTGTVSEVSESIGYGGKKYLKVVVKTSKEDEFDDLFEELASKPLSGEILPFLDALPGNSGMPFTWAFQNRVRTFIVSGVDREPMVNTNQFMLAARTVELKAGIERLRKLFRGCKVIVAAPPYLTAMARSTGAEVAVVDPAYPHSLPAMIIKKAFGVEVPAGKKLEELGASMLNAETIVALEESFRSGLPALNKLITVIGKDGNSSFALARLGTPVGEVLESAGIRTQPGDLLVQGGPMAGRSIHSENTPVVRSTDALLVRDNADVIFSRDAHCVNCGECVRACPARIPVNMLVRVLENGLWDEATGLYDLDSCMECGLCSYVCIARIPVFHYIMLGRHEAGLLARAEEADV